ncbi:MAG: ribosome maturation factor RimM [Longimicrobiales bacterium]
MAGPQHDARSGPFGSQRRGVREPERLVVGVVRRPHGVNGEVLVHPLTGHMHDVFVPGRELWLGETGATDDGPGRIHIDAAREHRGGMLLSLADVASRTAAEALVGRELLLEREALAPLAEDEVFYHDLVGLEVFDQSGARVGVVREVFEAQPADLLDVRGEAGAVLVPFTKRIIREVDLDAGRVVIEPPEGLLEL